MSRDARWVLAILAASLVGGGVLLVRLWRQVAPLAAELEQRSQPEAPEPILYAEVERTQAAPPARFAARLPRLQEISRRASDAFPPPAHVKDLLCAGDAEMWERLRASLAASGKPTTAQVWEAWGRHLQYCGGDGCFALDLPARGDRGPASLPAWVVLARCPGPRADEAFAAAGAPALAVMRRAEEARWGDGAGRVRAPPAARIVAAASEVVRAGSGVEHRSAAFELARTGQAGVEALLALHAQERSRERRRTLAVALSASADPRAQAIARAACAEDAEDPACGRDLSAPPAAPAAEEKPAPPPPALVARLRALGLLPEGATLEGQTAGELLLSAGRGHQFDAETDQYPNEHDSLLRALAALAGAPLRGAIFEELPQGEPDGDDPYLLRAYLGGERFETKARNEGDWYDVETTVGLLNALARARQLDVRWVVLDGGGQEALVVAGPEAGLRAAAAAGLLRPVAAGAATEEGKDAEAKTIREILKAGELPTIDEPTIGAEPGGTK